MHLVFTNEVGDGVVDHQDLVGEMAFACRRDREPTAERPLLATWWRESYERWSACPRGTGREYLTMVRWEFWVWRVPNTKCPVSAAVMAVATVSGSRISPTTMTSGSSRKRGTQRLRV